MTIIYAITIALILLYFLYPLWLMAIPARHKSLSQPDEIKGITVVLLSYNGKDFLPAKIDSILQELTVFSRFELLIIDDNSSDGSQELIQEYSHLENVKIMLKERHRGIPHTMNLAVEMAAYDFIVFCDQRQTLPDNPIASLTAPLKQPEVAAVSGCLSCTDKQQCNSFIRKYENFIKTRESRTGSLIGVYGPFYAIKKKFYSPIPDDIILDDLYLSIKMMKSGQIVLAANCQYTDDGPSIFYNYDRAKRYLKGFLQILADRGLLQSLTLKQLTMLFWHKYIRLLIPVFLAASYFYTGIVGMSRYSYLLAFVLMTFIALISVLPKPGKIRLRLPSALRINVLYFLALSDIIFYENFYKRIVNISRK